MNSHWSPAAPPFFYSDTNPQAPTQALQFENEIEDKIFDQAFQNFTWTAPQYEAQEHQFDDFILPGSCDRPLIHFESILDNPHPILSPPSTSATPGLQIEPSTSPAAFEIFKKPRKPYKKRKPLSEQEAIRKRERFLERNRFAASKCRLKQRRIQDQLKEDIERVESTNKALRAERMRLLEELEHLKNRVALCHTGSLRPEERQQRTAGSMYKCV